LRPPRFFGEARPATRFSDRSLGSRLWLRVIRAAVVVVVVVAGAVAAGAAAFGRWRRGGRCD